MVPLHSSGQTPTTPSSAVSSTAASNNRIVFNVSGVRVETYRSTLRNIADTRLAWLADAQPQGTEEWDAQTGEFFYDRHPGCFLMVLNFYRTGKLHAPIDVCGPMFESELTFWGIDETHIEPCCWKQYHTHRDAEATLQQLGVDGTYDDEDEDDESLTETHNTIAALFGIKEAEPNDGSRNKLGILAENAVNFWHQWRPIIWLVISGGVSSSSSEVNRIRKKHRNIMRCLNMTYRCFAMSFIFVSIFEFCFSTTKYGRQLRPSTLKYLVEKNITADQYLYDDVTGSPLLTPGEYRLNTTIHPSLTAIEIGCMLYFTLELLFRVLFAPRWTALTTEFLTWIDLAALIATYAHVAATFFATADSPLHTWTYGFELIITFRIFRLTRHMSGLRILALTIKSSAKELLLLVMFLLIFVLIFAAIIYFAEQIDERPTNKFQNIPLGFWWAVVTMTTLGYGDLHPQTAIGYIVGTVCAVIGLLAIALPVPVIVQNFANYYTHAQAVAKMPRKRRNYLLGAPDALKGRGSGSVGGTANAENKIVTGLDSKQQSQSVRNNGCRSPPKVFTQDSSLQEQHFRNTVMNGHVPSVVTSSASNHDSKLTDGRNGQTTHQAGQRIRVRYIDQDDGESLDEVGQDERNGTPDLNDTPSSTFVNIRSDSDVKDHAKPTGTLAYKKRSSLIVRSTLTVGKK